MTVLQHLEGEFDKIHKDRYIFSQVFAATVNFGCFLAADPITIPLYTLGLFKFGYPEVTGKIIGPFQHPEIYHGSISPVLDKFFRFCSILSGFAYVIHHTGICI